MKNCVKILLLGYLLFAGKFSMVKAASQNLIKNQDFKVSQDNFPIGWKYYGSRDKNLLVRGVKKKGVVIHDNDLKKKVGLFQIIKAVKAGHEYVVKLSCRNLKPEEKDGVYLQLRFLPSKKIYQVPVDLSGNKEFKISFVRGNAPKDSKSAVVYIYTSYQDRPRIMISEISMYDFGENMSKKPTAALPVCPENIPAEWLNKNKHPVMVCSKENFLRARQAVKTQPWIKKYLEQQQKKCDFLINLSDSELRSLVPRPGSPIVYGLGNNIDPVKGKRLKWAGWDNPFKVKDSEGNIYPNDKWPDDKFVPGKVYYRDKFFFTFRAYGFVHHELEQVVLPALADCYALSGDKKYAHAGAVLLDALAAAYSENKRGPLDYPNPQKRLKNCGRLDRANYMVARGMYNYAIAIDLIAPSGEFDKKSLSVEGSTIRENIIKNMLWNGGRFCLYWANNTRLLTNGRADYFRGSGIVGAILGERGFFDPMIKALQQMVDINLDRNGFYYETSTTYENHTISLYTTMAELVESSIVAHGWRDYKSFFVNKKLSAMISEFFNRREIGGHMPPIGDDGPDVKWNPALYRDLSMSSRFSNRFLDNQIKNAWIMLVRGSTEKIRDRAGALLKNSFSGKKMITPEAERWAVFHIGDKEIIKVNGLKADKRFFDTDSVFYGAKGIALLRGGKGDKRYGTQLFWGPISVHGQWDIMSWQFVSDGVQWSFVPGYCNTHFRFGWNGQSVSHQMMTVNQKSIAKECGNGFMRAWLDTPSVQWVMASHPNAYYNQGVKEYKRFLGQVQNPDNKKLAYWFDVGMVSGGKIRDDSFHTIMTEAEYNFPCEKMKQYSLLGDQYKGMTFGRDYRLSGFKDKGFYWIPPGDGYGFLIDPQVYRGAGTKRMVFKSPGFHLKTKVPGSRIIGDFATVGNDEMFIARSTGASSWIPSVPYVIRRKQGEKPSVFAKIIRVIPKNESDPIDKFTMLEISSSDPLANASIVAWKSGRQDLWMISNGVTGEVKLADGRKLSSDAISAMLTLDKTGNVVAVKMSGGTYLRLGKFVISGKGILRAEVKDIKSAGQKLQLSVDWKNAGASGITNEKLMFSMPEYGTNSTWKIKSVNGNTIVLDEFSATIAKTVFKPSGIPGWFYVETPISSFYTGKGHLNYLFAKGKRIVVNGNVVAEISGYRAGMYHLSNDGEDLIRKKSFNASVMELAPGDKICIPVNVSYKL